MTGSPPSEADRVEFALAADERDADAVRQAGRGIAWRLQPALPHAELPAARRTHDARAALVELDHGFAQRPGDPQLAAFVHAVAQAGILATNLDEGGLAILPEPRRQQADDED